MFHVIGLRIPYMRSLREINLSDVDQRRFPGLISNGWVDKWSCIVQYVVPPRAMKLYLGKGFSRTFEALFRARGLDQVFGRNKEENC